MLVLDLHKIGYIKKEKKGFIFFLLPLEYKIQVFVVLFGGESWADAATPKLNIVGP